MYSFYNGVAIALKSYAHQLETTGSSSDSLQSPPSRLKHSTSEFLDKNDTCTDRSRRMYNPHEGV